MEQRLDVRKNCNVKVKWLWMRQGMDEIELSNDVMWIMTYLIWVILVAGVECLVQHPREKITETLIPDRDVDCEKETVSMASKVWKRLTV